MILSSPSVMYLTWGESTSAGKTAIAHGKATALLALPCPRKEEKAKPHLVFRISHVERRFNSKVLEDAAGPVIWRKDVKSTTYVGKRGQRVIEAKTHGKAGRAYAARRWRNSDYGQYGKHQDERVDAPR
jgi:hypothetical protein